MLLRAVAITTSAVLLLFGIAAALLRNSAAAPPFSSPTTIRANSAGLRTHAPATNFPTLQSNLFQSASTDKTENGFNIEYSPGEESPWELSDDSVSTHQADGSGAIELGTGSIRLAFIGVSTERPHEARGSSPVPTPKYFTPDLKPADRNDPILKLEPYALGLRAGNFPAARFIFTCSNLTEFVALRFDAFDARTHYPLASWSYRPSPFRDTLSFDSPLKLWHQTSIDLRITLALGPIGAYSAPLVEGTELKFPGGALKLLAIAEGGLEIIPSGPGAPANTVALTKATAASKDRPLTSLVFCGSWPQDALLPWDLEFVDDAGTAMSAGFNAMSGPILVRTVDCAPERLKEFRVKNYPKVKKLKFTLSELPGLPEQNRNLQNLFELHVPRLEIQSLPQLKLCLGDLVQMQMKHVPLNPQALTNTSFQRQRTNTTPLALIEELSDSLSADYTLVIDSEKNEISTCRRPLAGPLNFVKSILRIKR